jgi:hypothetical protein
MAFAGPAVTLPLVLTYAGRGGQVILSEQAWDAVKPTVTQHPGAVSIVSLGTHTVSDDYPTPMLLMEVMPSFLNRRAFSRVMTKRMLEPGYRDAPDPKDPMTIMFIKVGARVHACVHVRVCACGCGGGAGSEAGVIAIGQLASVGVRMLLA